MRTLELHEMMLVSGGQATGGIPPGFTAVGDGSHYMSDNNTGAYHMTPGYEAQVRDSQNNGWGIDYQGVALDLVSIGLGGWLGASSNGVGMFGGWLKDAVDHYGELRDAIKDALSKKNLPKSEEETTVQP